MAGRVVASSSQVFPEWKETSEFEYWTATFVYEYVFENVATAWIHELPCKKVSPAFGDGRWHISIGTIVKSPGYFGVFLGPAQDVELQTSKNWLRRCEKCSASLGTPNNKGCYGKERNISGGYTFHSALESRRGQAKYIKVEKLEEDASFQEEQALHVTVELVERRRSLKPSPFGDIRCFANQAKLFYRLFDDAACADICFVFPNRKGEGSRTIYAQKSILASIDYFRSMFEFANENEGEMQSQDGDTSNEMEATLTTGPGASGNARIAPSSSAESSSDSVYDEDSDLELDDLELGVGTVSAAAGDLTLDSLDSQRSVSPTPRRSAKKRRISQVTAVPADEEPHSRRIQKITISSAAYSTYRALLLFVYSNSILWAPLRSTYNVHKKRSESRSRSMLTRTRFSREYGTPFSLVLDASDLEPTSPKSMYSLADMVQMSDLRDEALKQYIRCLSPDNICAELASPFMAKYDAVASMAVTYLRRNWKAVNSTTGWQSMLADGFGDLPDHLRRQLFSFIATLQVPVDDPTATE